MLRALRGRPGSEVGHVKVGERVVDEAVHGPGLAEHVLVHQARDEVRREGNHKGLKRERDRRAERESRIVGIRGTKMCCWPAAIP